jgi:hypothetical protein
MATKRVSEDYFQHLLWPCYVTQNVSVLEMQDVAFIDGKMPKDQQIALTLNILESADIDKEEQEQIKKKLQIVLQEKEV